MKRLLSALLLCASPAFAQANGWQEIQNGWGEIQTPPGYATLPAPASCTTPGQVGIFLGSPLALGCSTGLGYATSTGTLSAPKYVATVLATPGTLAAIGQGGTAGSTTYAYQVASLAPDGTTSPASAVRNTFTGNATLSATNYNIITLPTVAGVTTFRVYRTTGGATQGAIGDTSAATFNDTGLVASGTIPTLNTTGPITAGTLNVTGNVSMMAKVGIGSTSGGWATDHTLYAYDTRNELTGTVLGTGAYLTSTPSSASSANKYALVGEILATGTQNQTGVLAGAFIKAQSNDTATVSNLTGVRIETKNLTGAGTISAAKAIDAHVYTTTATMAEAWGYYGNTPLVLSTGAITKFTHIYLNDSTAAGTNYGFISPSTTMRNGIGTAAPASLLHVAGLVTVNSAQWVTGARPTCDASARGTVWYVAGGAGVADTFEICGKAAADTYSWVALATF